MVPSRKSVHIKHTHTEAGNMKFSRTGFYTAESSHFTRPNHIGSCDSASESETAIHVKAVCRIVEVWELKFFLRFIIGLSTIFNLRY